MFMSNKRVFLDSSILVEYYKNAATDLLDRLITEPACSLHISQIVLSEYVFHCLGHDAAKSPLALKTSGKIKETLSYADHALFLQQFDFLADDENIIPHFIQLMSSYNLLPNDALILAICKLNQIPALASHDSDFTGVCKQ